MDEESNTQLLLQHLEYLRRHKKIKARAARMLRDFGYISGSPERVTEDRFLTGFVLTPKGHDALETGVLVLQMDQNSDS